MHMHDPFAHCLARFFRFLFLTIGVHRLREAQRCLKDLLKTSWQNPSSQSHTQLVQDRDWKTWFVAVFQMVSVLSQEPHCPVLKGINSVWHLGSSTVCFQSCFSCQFTPGHTHMHLGCMTLNAKSGSKETLCILNRDTRLQTDIKLTASRGA